MTEFLILISEICTLLLITEGNAMAKYQETKDRYLKEKVETFLVRVPKGDKERIQDYAKSKGKSLNAYVLDLIRADMGE